MENGVKLSFYGNHLYSSPVKKYINIRDNLYAADIASIGAMKLELMLRRSNFRDYYDIYSILKEGISLKRIISDACEYSRHKLSTKNILSFISNGDNYKKEKDFNRLKPRYEVDHSDIEKYIKEIIVDEYS